MRKRLLAVCAALLTFFPAQAQPQEDVSHQVNQAFLFSLKLKLLGAGEEVVSVRDASMVTFSGKPIGIKLDGKTIRGVVAFTVYAERNKPMFLLAQAQLLVKEEPAKEEKYVAILKSIPFSPGELIEFYPLGKGNYGNNNILMEVKIDYFEGDPAIPNEIPPRSPPDDGGDGR